MNIGFLVVVGLATAAVWRFYEYWVARGSDGPCDGGKNGWWWRRRRQQRKR